jgi:hypothetical protein
MEIKQNDRNKVFYQIIDTTFTNTTDFTSNVIFFLIFRLFYRETFPESIYRKIFHPLLENLSATK